MQWKPTIYYYTENATADLSWDETTFREEAKCTKTRIIEN